jgi:hypothetical protein
MTVESTVTKGNLNTNRDTVGPGYPKIWPPETPLQFNPNYQRLPAGFLPGGRVDNTRGQDGRIVQHHLRDHDPENGNADDQLEDDLMKSYGVRRTS